MILKNSPLITRLSIFLTTILFFIHISLKFLINLLNPLLFLKEEYSELPFMVIIPGTSYLYIWTFFIAAFIENNFFTLILLLGLLYYGGRYLEKSWGSRSLIKFILIITIIPNILTWAWYIMRYIIERKIFFLTKSIHGGYALYSGFLVALKQLIPEHTVTLFKGILRIRIKYIPILYVFVTFFIGLLLRNGSFAMLAWLGFLISWIYLRFFKQNTPNLFSHSTLGFRGDTSETFAFVYFFPKPMHSLINMISKKIHHFLIYFHIFTPSVATQTQQSEGLLSNFQHNSDFFPHLNTSRFEAERRRAFALKALEQRLNSLENSKSNIESTTIESAVSTIEFSNQSSITDDTNKNQNNPGK
ncbi:hypothetical protein PCK1_002964 [Pneumocystis canis]|nr:hypothetical protein PCK1_002964 [Pneumocystis canis]